MSDDPIRWRDDPSIEADLGCRIDDVRALHRGYDLVGIRARALGPSPPPPPDLFVRGRRWVGVAGGGAAVLIAVLAGALILRSEPPATGPEAPSPLPTPAPVVFVPQEPAPVAAPPVTPGPSAAPHRDSAPMLGPAVEPTVVPPVVLPQAPIAEIERPSESSLLDAENREFEAAMDSLAGATPEEALGRFDAYLVHWPAAHLADEAQLARLECLMGLARWSEADGLSSDLAVRPSLLEKRPYVLRLRSEALAMLGRCDEAIEAASLVSRHQATVVRRACR